MKSELVFSDVDGTITTVRLGGIKYLVMLVWRRKLSIVTRVWRLFKLVLLAIRLGWKHWIERTISFETMFRRLHTNVFQGLAVKECKEIAAKHLNLPFRRNVLEEIQQRGAVRVAVTASVGDVYEESLRTQGFDQVFGTTLKVKDGVYTGQVLRLVNGDEKAVIVAQMKKDHRTVAYGDSKHDIPMLEAVDEAIAVHPDPTLAQHAAMHGYQSRM